MSDTPTPRTDAAEFHAYWPCGFQRHDSGQVVDADFARGLERELTESHLQEVATTGQCQTLLEERAVLRTALQTIRSIKPTNMACDYWSQNPGLDPEEVFDICDAALAAMAAESAPPGTPVP